MPSRLTRPAEMNVAATPMKAHEPLKPPMIDGFKPVKCKRQQNFMTTINNLNFI